MTTLRANLTEQGFDWETGEILYQETDDGTYPGWEPPLRGMMIGADHPILDLEYDSGFGGPHCPRFIARDKNAVYHPAQYDGSTWIERAPTGWAQYLGDNPEPTPYPGG